MNFMVSALSGSMDWVGLPTALGCYVGGGSRSPLTGMHDARGDTGDTLGRGDHPWHRSCKHSLTVS